MVRCASSDVSEKEGPTFCRSEETFIFPVVQAGEIYGMQIDFVNVFNVSIWIITC